MKLVRIIISVPVELKAKLDSLKTRGWTTSGYIRSVVERDFKTVLSGRKPENE